MIFDVLNYDMKVINLNYDKNQLLLLMIFFIFPSFVLSTVPNNSIIRT